MSDSPQPPTVPPAFPYPPPPGGAPPRYYPPPPPPRGGNPLLGCAFILSFVLNVIAAGLIVFLCIGVAATQSGNLADTSQNAQVNEVRISGNSSSKHKIAVVSLDGVIMEGMLNFVHHEIDQASRDSDVKAVVLRINSPGGSITASDELHRRLTELRAGNSEKKHNPKPLIVSMGSLAASGGYYVAMPAETLFAERTTLTGSIGVYASFPNVAGLAEKWDVGMTTIKQGEIKDSGSPFKKMTPKEVQVWQDMVDTAYDQFLEVVTRGRAGKLTKADLLAKVRIIPVQAGPPRLDKDKAAPYDRYLADGGIWTSEKARELKLVDEIGTLDDAIKAARDAANLGEDYRAVRYEKPKTLTDLLLNSRAPETGSLLDPSRLRAGLMPRIWFLSPGSELAGILAASSAGE